ncbi:MAG: hypothetical protein CL397_14180 [Acidiferrobacteraceae bacterium]|jgi:CO/xanthine dehydrogenase FAD-binding subunit|nr:hypothetical protein [Acidiferrobacteraceae bacterium]|tara:strand:- start:18234 stop:18974 length:741 start_codon:yes stop_codon:yes gene_type:complete
MNIVMAYHRPTSIDEACNLIAAGAVILAGGTKLNRNTNPYDGPPIPRDLVDIQSLGLDQISTNGTGNVTIGACATIQQVADDDRLPPVVRDAARREAPRTIRNTATIGGTAGAAVPQSELLAALLAHGATIRTESATGAEEFDLSQVLVEGADYGLITEVTIETTGIAVAERVGRTPSDNPIVAVVGRQVDGVLTLGIAGIATVPVLADPSLMDELEPPGDFRGSTEYRRHLATVLTNRVIKELSQ